LCAVRASRYALKAEKLMDVNEVLNAVDVAREQCGAVLHSRGVA
jgi:hypothetical protein